MVLSKEQILAAQDCKIEKLHVEPWGEVCVRVMSGKARDEWELSARAGQHSRAAFCAAVLCDELGNLLFSKNEIEKLGEKSSAALDQIVKAGLRLNGFDLDTLEKN